MKLFLFIALLLTYISIPSYSLSARLSADEFMAPIEAKNDAEQAASTKINDSSSVSKEKGFDNKPAIKASTAQDAVNAGVKHIAVDGGCLQIKFPSGFGWVATGVSTYSPMSNSVATLIAQRHAYQKAYLQAKKNLAESLYGLSTSGKEALSSEMDIIISSDDSAANNKENFQESISEKVNGLLRGYVVYNIEDVQDSNYGTVKVTIVTTPKTMGQFARVGNSGISADSIRDGLNHVLAELGNGLMPPVGGKTIAVPQTGELAFVGFGTAVVVPNPNPAIQAKMRLNAQKIAQMRARSALCGIILGDEVSATSKLDEKTKELTAQFEALENNDPLKKATESSDNIKKLQEQRVQFLNNQSFKEEIASFRSGVIPAGVTVKTFFNENNTVAEAVAIYLPSVTFSAGESRRLMQNNQIVTPRNDTRGAGNPNNSGVMPQRGPSGQVSNDADL